MERQVLNKDKRGNTDDQTWPSSECRWLVHLKNVQTQPFKSHYQGVMASHTHRREDCSPLVCPDGVCGRSYGGVFAWVRGLLLLLLKVERPFHSRFPALGLALGLGQLHHKEGKNNHGTKKGKHWDSLAHLLIIATGHYSWGKTETLITAMRWLNSKSHFCGWQLVDYFLNTQQKFLSHLQGCPRLHFLQETGVEPEADMASH